MTWEKRVKLQEYKSLSMYTWYQPHNHVLQANIHGVEVFVRYNTRQHKYVTSICYSDSIARYCNEPLPSVKVAEAKRLDKEIAERLLTDDTVTSYLTETDHAEKIRNYQEAEDKAKKEVQKNLKYLKHVSTHGTMIDAEDYQTLAKFTRFLLEHEDKIDDIFSKD